MLPYDMIDIEAPAPVYSICSLAVASHHQSHSWIDKAIPSRTRANHDYHRPDAQAEAVVRIIPFINLTGTRLRPWGKGKENEMKWPPTPSLQFHVRPHSPVRTSTQSHKRMLSLATCLLFAQMPT